MAPVATASDFSASSGQVINVSSLFSASDVDGDACCISAMTPNSASGCFTVNGVVKPAGTTFAVTAAQLAQTDFHAGGSDTLFGNVRDGVAYSGAKEFHVNTVAAVNHAPVVSAPDYSASSAQVINATSLFSASDADNDPLLYFFYDNTAASGSGYFTVNGVVKPAGVTFAVSAAQLAQEQFPTVSTAMIPLQPDDFHVI